MDDPISLLQDVPACHALIAELSRTLAELHGARTQLSQENAELKLTVERLLARLYGRRSERVVRPQPAPTGLRERSGGAGALADAAEKPRGRANIRSAARSSRNSPATSSFRPIYRGTK
jgi:hypothetical protein